VASISFRLESHLEGLKNATARQPFEVVMLFESAITSAYNDSKYELCLTLIEDYLSYFADPVPYDINLFCAMEKLKTFWMLGDRLSFKNSLENAISLAEQFNDTYSLARAYLAKGVFFYNEGDFEEAFAHIKKSEKGLRSRGGDYHARCLNWLGYISFHLGRYKDAWQNYSKALQLNEKLELTGNQGYVLHNFGILCKEMGFSKQAEKCFQDSVNIQKNIENRVGYAEALVALAMLYCDLKRYKKAIVNLEEAVILFERHENSESYITALIFLAVCYAHLGFAEKGFILFNKVEKLLSLHNHIRSEVVLCIEQSQIHLQFDNILEAEELILRGIKKAEHIKYFKDNGKLDQIYSDILFAKEEYKKGFVKLRESQGKAKKYLSIGSYIIDNFVSSLLESARSEKQLQLFEIRNNALKMSEKRFMSLVNGMSNIGVLAVDMDGVVTFWNETCSTFYGYSSEFACGRKLTSLIVPEHLHEWFLGYIRNSVIDTEFELNLRASNDSMKDILVSFIPFGMDEIFIVQVDLTSQRIAENQKSLIEAQMRRTQKLEALGTLAGGIAHDFNNLLQGILGNSVLLNKNLLGDEQALAKLELIQLAAEKSTELCTQMLDYAGMKPVSHKPVCMNDIIRDIRSLLTTSIPKSVTLSVEFHQLGIKIMGDSSQLRQVVMNLVLNAAESISNVGIVKVFTEVVFMDRKEFDNNLLEEKPFTGEFLLLRVEDTGSGIDQETLTRIFDPFYTTKKTGRGLGLAAVLGIIRGHAGAIMVDSNVGKGTEFRVYFPKFTGEIALSKTAEPVKLQESLRGKKILLVDDDEIVRETVSSILTALDFKPVVVPGGAEAFEYLRNNTHPDLMMLDLTMPGMNGDIVFKQLRSEGMTFPVLIVSGYSAERISSLFPDNKPDDFLQKPFTPKALKSVLNKLF